MAPSIIWPFLFLIIAAIFREPIYQFIQEQNLLAIHLIVEMFMVGVCFTIATQAWLIVPHTLSNHRLWLGALFFAIGIMEIFHTIAYEGMPFFIYESSPYRATWLYMAIRLSLAVFLIFIFVTKERRVNPRLRWFMYIAAFVYGISWVAMLYAPSPLLPELVIEGMGTTALKKMLHVIAFGLQLSFIFVLLHKPREQTWLKLMLIFASLSLCFSDFFFTTYISVTEVSNFMGRLFQVAAFYFILRGLYYSSVEEPFQRQKEAEEQLRNQERFLHMVTSNLGEGLFVTDLEGRLTFMNPEAERLLQWKQEELLGSRVHDSIHKHTEDGSLVLYEECPLTLAIANAETYRVEHDYFVRKDGSEFPVYYVSSPYYDNGRIAGGIAIFHDITEIRSNQETIKYMAYHDELTGLPNLRYFTEKIEENIKLDRRFSLLLIDIDRFRLFNESFGQSFGDVILKLFASRLRHLLPETRIGRMKGDEFLIMVPNGEKHGVDALCNMLVERVQEPLQARQLSLNLKVHIGAVRYPEDGYDQETLLRNANIALSEAKKNMRDYVHYNPDQAEASQTRMLLENDLHQALEKEQLYLVYHPQVDTATGSIVAMEALLRWRHPTRGEVSPAEFVPIAEESGLIIPIGEWVLRTACQQIKEWHESGLPHLRMSVNLSTRQFYQQDLPEVVAGILQETGLNPEVLELEITESMTMDVTHARELLWELKKVGVKISIDDFGTGYSSLAYLKQLPIDRLKIDRSFIQDLATDASDAAIVTTIISMARSLGMEVVAEGVETREQASILHNHGCDLLQGYLISPPRSSFYNRDFHNLQQEDWLQWQAMA